MLEVVSVQEHFIDGKAQQDEAWFILVHVDIEAQAAKGIKACLDMPSILSSKDKLEDALVDLKDSATAMNATFSRMPEGCSEDIYFQKVRPYIFGFENVIYEECFDNQPQNFRGETGAQSSIIPLFQITLGIQHKESTLTKHLNVMRDYMPAQHRNLLIRQEDWVEKTGGLREFVKDNHDLKLLYNDCLKGFLTFRQMHLEYAISYIQKKVESPTGTGGTPFIPWLTQLIKESETYYL